MEKKGSYFLQAAIGLISTASLLYFFNQKWFGFLIKEDGVLENITALTLLVSSVLLLLRFVRVRTDKNML